MILTSCKHSPKQKKKQGVDEVGAQLSLGRNHAGDIHEPPMKRREAILDRAKLNNLHAKAGMGGGGPKRVETKDVHLY